MKRRPSLGSIFLTVFIDLLGFGIIIPLLPFYAESFGASALMIGLLGTSFSLMQFLVSPIWGRWSDRIGRKPIILVGLMGSCVSYLALALAGSLPMVFLARIIGGIAGVLVCVAMVFVDQVLKIDDPVGAISVHGVCGAFGTLMVGVFSDGSYGDGWNGVPGTVKGILYGDASQLMAQFVGVGTCFVFVFVAFFAFFKIVEATMGNRVSAEAELEGLDIPEMGALAYPDFVLGPGTPLGGGMPMSAAPSGAVSGQASLRPLEAEGR